MTATVEDGMVASGASSAKPGQAALGPRAADGSIISVPRQWYMIFALTVLGMVAAVDRSAISLVLDLIKQDLRLSDTQLGLLVGASYTLFHILVTFPMGWIIDRFSRKWALIIGGVAWSICTVCTGLANSFWQLFAGRAGVGFAEGGVAPATFSMIRDGVASERQGRAFALYGTSPFVGGSAALLLSAAILSLAESSGPITLPFFGVLKPWQLVFVTLGLASMAFIGLMLFVREPGRSKSTQTQGTSYMAALRYMIGKWRILLPLISFNAIFGIAVSYGTWTPTLVHRNYGVPLREVGPTMALITLIAPALGLFIFGSLVDRFTRMNVRYGPALMIVFAVILTAFPAIATPYMPTLTTFWISYFFLMLISVSLSPATNVIATRLTPSPIAGKIAVLYALPTSIISIVIGGVFVGVLSDQVFSGPKGLGQAISTTAIVFLPLALLLAVWLVAQTRNLATPEESERSQEVGA